MDDIYKNIDEYNPNKKRKILIVFDDMIADMLTNKKSQLNGPLPYKHSMIGPKKPLWAHPPKVT